MPEEDKRRCANNLIRKRIRRARPKRILCAGLVERGEAAKADENGNLPPGATHEIVGTSTSGVPIVVRRRFAGKRF